ncbi:19859_t:CDS:2, partial [Gigaspora margarita]
GVIQAIFKPKSSKKLEKLVLQFAKIAHCEYFSLCLQRLKVVFNNGCKLVQGIIPVNSVKIARPTKATQVQE